MTIHKIMPGDLFVREGAARIKTRCPREFITDAMIMERVISANLDLGDTIEVKCFNHEKTQTLYFAAFEVVGRAPEIRRVEVNDRDSKTFEHVGFTIMQTAPWTATAFGKALEAETKKKAA